jgi:hypothetical protein
MDTDALITSLARDVKPVPRSAIGRRLAIGLAFGGVATCFLVGWWLGFRHDWGVVARDYRFWMKWLYALSLGIGAIVASARLARPDAPPSRHIWLLALPVLVMALFGAMELIHTPPGDWLAMWLGQSWRVCPRNVLVLSMPIFVSLLWAYRRLAPTRLRAAGAAAGLTAGAFGAALYCLHCPEMSAIFVLTWYTLGIAAATVMGALVGPKLLRW